MMKLLLFLALFITVAKSQSENSAKPHSPTGLLQYNDPDGLKVSWKLYAPYNNQFKSYVEAPRKREERADNSHGYRVVHRSPPTIISQRYDLDRAPATAPEKKIDLAQAQLQYKPYSAMPSHIKDLLVQMYKPHVPYIDPGVFIYTIQPTTHEQSESRESSTYDNNNNNNDNNNNYSNRGKNEPPLATPFAGFFEQPRYEQNLKFPYKFPANKAKPVSFEPNFPTSFQSNFRPMVPSYPPSLLSSFNDNTKEPNNNNHNNEGLDERRRDGNGNGNADKLGGIPKEIHQLLSLQANMPYHVIANRIHYKPKSMFVPRPLSDEDASGSATKYTTYRSKVYYLKDGEFRDDDQQEEEEDQQSKGGKDRYSRRLREPIHVE